MITAAKIPSMAPVIVRARSQSGARRTLAIGMISTLQIVGNLDRGGGQEVVRTLARFLPEEGCAPVVVTLRDGPLRAELEALGIPVEIVAGRTRPFLSTGSVAELRRIRSDLDHLVRR